MKTIVFIINPIAGTTFRVVKEETIYSFFKDKPYSVKILHTEYAGHGKQLAKNAVKNNVDIVVVAGGDGSINEIGAELLHTSVKLGIIPIGSGNGLAHHLRLPFQLKKLLRVFEEETTIRIDAGLVQNQNFTDQVFFSNCGFGYDAEVIHAYSKVKQRGFFTYLFFMFKSIFTLQPKKARLQFNEFDETLYPFVFTVANSSQYGYKIEVAPDASISDGILDALLVRDATTLRVLQFSILSMLKLRDKVLDVADFFKIKQATISFEEPIKIQIDGEPFIADGDLSISIQKAALSVIVPNI